MEDSVIIIVDEAVYSELDFCLAYRRELLSNDEVTFCLGDYTIDMPADVAFSAITEAAERRVSRMPKCLGPRKEVK